MRVSNSVLPSILCLVVFVASLTLGCGPPAQQSGGEQQSGPESGGSSPALSDDVIRERINDARVWDVPPESGTAEPISWGFDEDEPKEITVIDKQVNGRRATIVLDIKTSSAPRARARLALAGQIRTEWELRTGWVIRRWEIVRTENISMKFRELTPPPPPPAPNTNGGGTNSPQ